MMCTLAWVVAFHFTNGPHCEEAKGPIGETLGCAAAFLSFGFCIWMDILLLTLLRKATGY